MQQHYELVYLLRVTSPEEEAKKLHQQITDTITKNGSVTKAGEIGNRKLAYPINKEHNAIYWLVEFEAETTVNAELHKLLTLDGNVIRFQIVAARPKTQEDIEREERFKESLEKSKIREHQKEKEKERIQKKEEEPLKPKEEKEKLTLDELDKKLDELLDDDTIST